MAQKKLTESVQVRGKKGPKDDWREVVFSDVIKINDYPKAKKGEEYTCVGMKDLARNKRKIQNSKKKKYTYSRPRFRNGDTLFARITPCLENGKTAFVDILDEGEIAFGSTEFIVMSATDRTIPRFVYYTARRPKVRKFAIKRMTGTSGRQRVPLDIFDNLKIRIPPIQEQKKIISVLDALDTKIETNNRINQLLEEIAQIIFKHWFVDFEPYEEFKDSDLGRIPKDSKVKKLVNICNLTFGYAFDSSKFNEEGKGIGVIRIRNLPDNEPNKFTKEGFDSKYLIEPGNLLISMDGEFRPYIWKGKEAALNQRVCKLEGKKRKYSPIFLYFIVKKPLRKLEKSKTGTTVIHLLKRDIDRIKVVLPDQKSLEKFNKISKSIYKKMVDNEKENRVLKKLRNILLPKLMSGEIGVTEDAA